MINSIRYLKVLAILLIAVHSLAFGALKSIPASKRLGMVTPKRPISFTISSDSTRVMVGNSIRLTGEFPNGRLPFNEIRWDFGDGTKISTKNVFVNHIFKNPGNYKIKSTLVAGKTEISSDTSVLVVGNYSAKSTATQILINQTNYIEIIPGQQIGLNFSEYSGDTLNVSFSSVVWNASNSNVSIASASSNGATVTGVTPGTSTVSVTVDGLNSQTITIKVLDFDGSGVITQRGKFAGNNRSEYCVYVNQVAHLSDYVTYKEIFTGASGMYQAIPLDPSNYYLGGCLNVDLPLAQDSLEVDSTLMSGGHIFTKKSGLKSFYGRGAFLYVKNDAQLQFQYNDDRLVNFNSDFSITYWTLMSSTGDLFMPYIHGVASIVPTRDAQGKLTVSGASGTETLNFPTGKDFKNRWAHVGLTYESLTRILTYYIDGEPIGSVVVPSGSLALPSIVAMVFTGNSSNGTALDEVRFWNKALTSTEVSNELFNPVDVSSSSILASFSFDTNTDDDFSSENGSGWTFEFLTVGSSPKPQTRFVPAKLIDSVMAVKGAKKFEASIPFGNFGNNKLIFESPDDAFDFEKRLFIQASSCITGCTGEDLPSGLKSKKFSPYIFVNDIALSNYSLILQIPIDVQTMTENDFSNLTVMQLNQDGQFDILQPLEKNAFEGYVKVAAFSGGQFWVGTSDVYTSSIPKFTNPDLFQSITDPSRYNVKIDINQPSYTVNADSTGAGLISGVSCLPSSISVSSSTFPMTFSNLSEGSNSCVISYSLHMGLDAYGQDSYVFPGQMIFIEKGHL